jgi:hypothetical protein
MILKAQAHDFLPLLLCFGRLLVVRIISEPHCEVALDDIAEKISILSLNLFDGLNRFVSSYELRFFAWAETPKPFVQLVGVTREMLERKFYVPEEQESELAESFDALSKLVK